MAIESGDARREAMSEQTRRRWLAGWRHAFAANPPLPELTARQQELANRFATAIVRRRLTAPTLAFLEMGRPLNRLAAQGAHVLTPLISTVLPAADWEEFAALLERRDAIEILCQRIEDQERSATAAEQARRGQSRGAAP